jgi:hypothetical protein
MSRASAYSTSPKSDSVNVKRWAQSSAMGRTRFDLPLDAARRSGSPAPPPYVPPSAVNQPPQPAYEHRTTPSMDQRTHVSARESYPTFLPFAESLKLQAGWALRGLVDASRWDIVVRLLATYVLHIVYDARNVERLFSDAEVRANVFKSVLLNGISLLSVSVLDFLLHPLARDRPDSWLHRNLGLLYQILWLAPVVGASLYLNVRVRLPACLLACLPACHARTTHTTHRAHGARLSRGARTRCATASRRTPRRRPCRPIRILRSYTRSRRPRTVWRWPRRASRSPSRSAFCRLSAALPSLSTLRGLMRKFHPTLASPSRACDLAADMRRGTQVLLL